MDNLTWFVDDRRYSLRSFLSTIGSVLVCLIVSAGCRSQPQVDTVYGQRRGAGVASVNGTLVLAKQFEQAGCRVSSWRRLSPKLEKDQVIVWVPDRFGVPHDAEIRFFDEWLGQGPNRTLVFIGRNYDAGVDYWRRVVAQTDGIQRVRARRQWARARSTHVTRQQSAAENADCDWFSLTPQRPVGRVDTVQGRLAGPSGSLKVNLPLTSEVKVKRDEEDSEWDEGGLWVTPLLTSGPHILAARLARPHWSGSRVIVIADGSWLLNLPQVDPANRQLAANLIDACLPADHVCFLESGEESVQISDTDAEVPLLVRLFRIWPINFFLFHLVLVGLIFCFYVWPIFGRPRRLADDRVSDFGKHIAAVGELMERGQDYAHANAQINQYHELIAAKSPPGSSVSHGKGPN
jgi:hypothetical protein